MIRLSLLLLVALLGSCPLEPPHPRLAAQQTSAEIPPIANRAAIPDFVSLVKREGGTVVNVSATRILRGSELEAAIPGLSPDDPLYEFFRRLLPPGSREYQAQSLGSGFIVSEDGYILTNAHLVEDADGDGQAPGQARVRSESRRKLAHRYRAPQERCGGTAHGHYRRPIEAGSR